MKNRTDWTAFAEQWLGPFQILALVYILFFLVAAIAFHDAVLVSNSGIPELSIHGGESQDVNALMYWVPRIATLGLVAGMFRSFEDRARGWHRLTPSKRKAFVGVVAAMWTMFCIAKILLRPPYPFALTYLPSVFLAIGCLCLRAIANYPF